MRIDSAGNVGIGTTSPESKLHIKNNFTTTPIALKIESHGQNDSKAKIELKSIGSGGGYVSGYISQGRGGSVGGHEYYIGMGGGDGNSLAVTNGGRVGIGTLSPGYTLDVNGTLRVEGTITGNISGAAGSATRSKLDSIFWARDSGIGVYTNLAGGQGIGLFNKRGSLPGHPNTIYATLKTTHSSMYFATGGGWYTNTGGTYVGYLTSADVGQIDFTGQHQALPVDEDLFNNIDEYVGRIVISNGDVSSIVADVSNNNYFIKTGKEGITINESIPRVILCNTYKDKRVFGVISPEEEDDEIKNMESRSTEKHFKMGSFVSVVTGLPADDNRIIINSIGEGAVWVNNKYGNIENGDYITTSENGYGTKQDDDLMHNYTIAKATINCEFELNSDNYECKEITHNDETYKIAFIACVYCN